MKRPFAVLTGIAVTAGGLMLGAAPARADLADFASATASTAAQHGSGTALRIGTQAGRVSALTLLDDLPVRSESHSASYARSRFGGWIDRDADGENTRAEVLKAESTRTASLNRFSTVKGGKWVSAYDNRVFTNASRMDVDHMVPLAEAWASGAYAWSARKRAAFANDLDYGPSLIAVSLSSNRSKGDKDPAEWMPRSTAYTCTYVRAWVAVKSRWNISVDRAEKAAIRDTLAGCSSVVVTKPGKPNISHLLPAAALKAKPVTRKPVAHKPVGGSGGGSAYYANCSAVRAAGKAPLRAGQPGYETPRLDRDGDGVACE